ncbi:MAG: DUF4914 family protein [Marinilabiliales bacterium]|nr:MAG: DUF4914 family protein [Marinilabiliales bacterium]
MLPDNISLPEEVSGLLSKCPDCKLFTSSAELADAAVGGKENNSFEVSYEIKGKGKHVEAMVHRVANGISVNYTETYMRRRDPDTLVVADDKPSDKERFSDKYGSEFSPLRQETIDWLIEQQLGYFIFKIGPSEFSYYGIAIAPANAAFFCMGLSLLQKIIDPAEVKEEIAVKSVVYVAPTFRHTHFDGKQVVVHNRTDEVYEIFSYNLYPGPSAKKGIYGVLLSIGEFEGWSAPHCSAVQSVSPYDNITTFMHEGASGGGKSEMLQMIVREPEGSVEIGENTITGEKRATAIPQFCKINPVCDDMGIVHPSYETGGMRLRIMDAEHGWFIRTDNITGYGCEPQIEKLTINSTEPLLFLNIRTNPGGTALIWNHIEDEPGKPCPNPRVVVPRQIFPGVVNKPVSVDVRSFGVRTPPCSAENPSYGIIGLFHILPPALAWLWRLVSPRGHANPSIVDSDKMGSEGVGSYWPFATGLKVTHANLLLDQIVNNTVTQYVLTPNQYIGVWKVGFKPQLLMREYLTRRGNAKFRAEQYQSARCPLLGFELNYLTIEGSKIPSRFLKVYRQEAVGFEGYDKGAEILKAFFHEQLPQYQVNGLSDLGRRIIETCLDNGNVEDYESLIEKR